MTAATLILSLLAQTAAAGPAVCAMIDSAPMASVMQDHQHAHNTQHHEERAHHHAAVSDSGQDLVATDDCCANMDAIDCATSGCVPGSATVILTQSLSAVPVQPYSSLDRERAWLPPYVTPCSDIYRPPNA
ncbi:MAG TPA: hypothetical protein VIS76_12155 [Pseudomonadales bacterium]